MAGAQLLLSHTDYARKVGCAEKSFNISLLTVLHVIKQMVTLALAMS